MVFLINVLVVLAFLLAAPVLLREVRATSVGRIELPGLLLSFTGFLLLTYSIKSAAAVGFTTQQIVTGIVGTIALTLFIRRQTNIAFPLLGLYLFKDRIFLIAILTGLLSLVVWSAAGYLSGIYLQSVLGLEVFTTALLSLPGAVVLTATCIFTSRIGRKAALIATHLFIGAGVLLLLLTTIEAGAIAFLASTMIASVVCGLSFSLIAEIAVSAVPPERAGAAGSIAETSNEIGNALGITLLGSLAALIFRLSGPGVTGTLNKTFNHASITVQVVIQAKEAFLSGLHLAVGLGGIITLMVGVAAWLWLPRTLPE